MVDTSSKSNSLKDYLKKYTTNNDEEKKKKKLKKRKHAGDGVLIVDKDPIWQKPVKLLEEDSSDEEKPQVVEDIDVKRMKRLELIRSRRPFGVISEDGSGWVSVSENPRNSEAVNQSADIFPANRRHRMDTPSPKSKQEPSSDVDAKSPEPLQQRKHSQSSSPEVKKSHLPVGQRARYDSPSPKPYITASESNTVSDLSPPRRKQMNKSVSSLESGKKLSYSTIRDSDIPPLRRAGRESEIQNELHASSAMDLSPPRKMKNTAIDLSPPRKMKNTAIDFSPPRKMKNAAIDLLDGNARKSRHNPYSSTVDVANSASEHISPRKRLEKPSHLTDLGKTGLVSGVDVKEEIDRKKREDILRFKEMDASVSGRNAEPVYRDKITGERVSKEEFLKSVKYRQKKEKPKEVQLEWGKGLAQKREAEARLEELEIEKNKPFARSRDDPDLDRMLKERIRWGDPMAHLVNKKQSAPFLPDFGESEKMKESGFMIPQEIPSHSWIKRGLDAAPNRYGIKPGRHWDGVDRSNGYEKELFKRSNEKTATEREAYLWSVSEM